MARSRAPLLRCGIKIKVRLTQRDHYYVHLSMLIFSTLAAPKARKDLTEEELKKMGIHLTGSIAVDRKDSKWDDVSYIIFLYIDVIHILTYNSSMTMTATGVTQ